MTARPSIELDAHRLLGFDRLVSDGLEAGRLCDPRVAMVGFTKPPPPPPPDGIQARVEDLIADPRCAETLCGELVERIRAEVGEIDLVVAAAVGGLVVGYEVARQLGVPFASFERAEEGFAPRRGVEIPRTARCVVVDDTVRSGRSMRECVAAAETCGARVLAAACLVADRHSARDVSLPLLCVADDPEALALRTGRRTAA